MPRVLAMSWASDKEKRCLGDGEDVEEEGDDVDESAPHCSAVRRRGLLSQLRKRVVMMLRKRVISRQRVIWRQINLMEVVWLLLSLIN
jgi:hypothetical protein